MIRTSLTLYRYLLEAIFQPIETFYCWVCFCYPCCYSILYLLEAIFQPIETSNSSRDPCCSIFICICQRRFFSRLKLLLFSSSNSLLLGAYLLEAIFQPIETIFLADSMSLTQSPLLICICQRRFFSRLKQILFMLISFVYHAGHCPVTTYLLEAIFQPIETCFLGFLRRNP